MPDSARRSTRIAQFTRVLFLTTFSLLAIGTRCAYAQDADDVLRIRTDLVTIPLTVTDSRGRRVPGLGADDFLIDDNGRTTAVSYFAVGADRVALLFALDSSGSARETLAQQRETATALYSRFGHDSRIAVLQFSQEPKLVVPFTADSSVAARGFKFESERDAGTAIFDGAAAAVRAFDTDNKAATERRIIILISDGLDTRSRTKYRTVVELARLRGVSFYVIQLALFAPRDGRLMPRPATKGFRELAEQTGGHYFRVGDAAAALNPDSKIDLSPIFKAIEEDLKGQYVVGFYPDETNRAATRHQVHVSLKPARGRKFRLRQIVETYDLNP